MKMLEAMIFDAGDVIVLRNEHAFTEAVEKLQKAGWKGTPDLFKVVSREIAGILSKGLRDEYIQHILQHYDLPPVFDYRELEVKAFWDNPNPEAKELFQELKTLGIKLGILTDSVLLDEKVRGHLERHELLQYLDAVCTSATTQYVKPDPEAYLGILRSLNTTPSKSIAFIGHSEDELIGARNMGMITVEYSPKSIGLADYHITKLLDLIPLCKEL